MRILIKNIEYEESGIITTCNTEIGDIKGVWRGKTTPVINSICHIELNLQTIQSDQINVLHKSQDVPKVYCCNNCVFFKGICEDFDEVYFIRFMQDWLEMLDFPSIENIIDIGDTVLFWTNYRNIGIYPYDMY